MNHSQEAPLLGGSHRNDEPGSGDGNKTRIIDRRDYQAFGHHPPTGESSCSDWSDLQQPPSEGHMPPVSNSSASMDEPQQVPLLTLFCILSTSFSYGCILTTLFLITLPMECERIHQTHPDLPKSVALGAFVAVAGVTQLISPLAGRLSDNYQPPDAFELGQRLPYLVLGSFSAVIGLFGQMFASEAGNVWLRYGGSFLLNMIGLTLMYSMMLALIPDQVPAPQTGVANAVLALLLTTGSLFGFGLMQLYYDYYYSGYPMMDATSSSSQQVKDVNLSSVYALYICVVIISTILTGTYGHDRDVELMKERTGRRHKSSDSSDEESLEDVRTLMDRTGRGRDVAEDRRETEQPHRRPRRHHSLHRRLHHAVKQTTHKAAQAVIVTPTMILSSLLVEPFRTMDLSQILQSYVIDRVKYRDFYYVTLSRLFYYCGMSVQTFFLYFLKDIIHSMHHKGPETAVASLAILGQCAAAVTCYPVGVLSDQCLGGRRKPFIYLACVVLSAATATIVTARTLSHMMHLCLVIGAANGVYLTMDTSLAVDTLPSDSELAEDDSSGSAQLLGVWGVAAFLGTTLGPMIGGPLLYAFGRDSAACDTDPMDCPSSGVPTEERYTIEGYAVVLGLSSFYYLLSAGMLCYVGANHK